MIKKLTFIIATMFMTSISIAQISKATNNTAAEAKKMLDEVTTKFKNYKTVEAAFTLTIENSAGKNLGIKKGTLSMKGLKYKIKLTGQEMYSDASNIWTYDQAANEVTVNKYDPTSNSITPQKLFTNFYDKDFSFKKNGIVKIGSKSMIELELTPNDKTKSFSKVLIYIDNGTINTTKVFEKNGNRYTYSIGNMKTNTPITDASFVFDAKSHPNVEVIDLR